MIRIRNLDFHYPGSAFTLRIDDLVIGAGERFGLTGPSGSGKTTLINIIAGILKPRAGEVVVAGTEISRRNDRRNREFRISNIGFIFQNFELLDYLTVEQNILLPITIGRGLRADAAIRERMESTLERMGIADRRRAYPRSLSQGEKQRVAICRAVINEPRLVIADEPTANLDRRNAARVIELILEIVQENRSTFLMVTHDPAYFEIFPRRLDLADLEEGSAQVHATSPAGSQDDSGETRHV